MFYSNRCAASLQLVGGANAKGGALDAATEDAETCAISLSIRCAAAEEEKTTERERRKKRRPLDGDAPVRRACVSTAAPSPCGSVRFGEAFV